LRPGTITRLWEVLSRSRRPVGTCSNLPNYLASPDLFFAGIDLSSSLLFRRLAVFTCPETSRRIPNQRKYLRKALCSTPIISPGSLCGYFGISSLCDFFLEESILPVLEKKKASDLSFGGFILDSRVEIKMAAPTQLAFRTLKGISIMDAAPVYQPLSGFEKPEGNLRCSGYSPCGRYFAWASPEK
jgi:hypothetical protein